MNTATDLLTTAQHSGLMLSLDGEKLRVRWQGQPPPPALLADLKAHKAELIALLASNDAAFTLDRYRHLVTCQSCAHLSANGRCKVKADYKPIPNAKRNCSRHQITPETRQPVAMQPYSQQEIEALLRRHESQLLAHLVHCQNCRASDRRWCADGFAVGSAYDALLLCFEDAGDRHHAFVNRVIKKRLESCK